MAIDPSFMGGTFGTSSPAPNPLSLTSLGIFVQVPNLQVSVNGNPVNATLLGATISYGFDIGISTATVEFTAANIGSGGAPTDPTHTLDGVGYFDNVEIRCGGNPNGPNYNALRFSGLYLRTEATMWPGVFQMVCKGNLYRATQYFESTIFIGIPAGQIFGGGVPIGTPVIDYDDGVNPVFPGLIPGGLDALGVDTTDDNIVFYILNRVPGLNVDFNDIHGTGKVIFLSWYDATWPPYRSAWDQVQIFDQAFLGYRTFENLGGKIVRLLVYGYPSGPDTGIQFTEGHDIWEAQGSRTVEPLINACYVEGMSQTMGSSLGDVQVIYAYVESGNPFQTSGPVVEQFSSPFIEANATTDPDGSQNVLHCEEVANWRLTERNRELVNVTLTTYRDDPIAAGWTVAVNAPHAAVTEPVWVQRVEVRVQSEPALFQQTIYGLGGGIEGDSGSQSIDSSTFGMFLYG